MTRQQVRKYFQFSLDNLKACAIVRLSVNDFSGGSHDYNHRALRNLRDALLYRDHRWRSRRVARKVIRRSQRPRDYRCLRLLLADLRSLYLRRRLSPCKHAWRGAYQHDTAHPPRVRGARNRCAHRFLLAAHRNRRSGCFDRPRKLS